MPLANRRSESYGSTSHRRLVNVIIFKSILIFCSSASPTTFSLGSLGYVPFVKGQKNQKRGGKVLSYVKQHVWAASVRVKTLAGAAPEALLALEPYFGISQLESLDPYLWSHPCP